MDAAIIFAILGFALIFVVLVMLLFDPTLVRGVALGLGGICTQTADCRSGLVCVKGADPNFTNPQCLIPESGSCFWNPTFCTGGMTCHNGACVRVLTHPGVEASPVAPSAKLMTPATGTASLSVETPMAETALQGITIDPTLPFLPPTAGGSPFPGPTPHSSPAPPECTTPRWPRRVDAHPQGRWAPSTGHTLLR